MPHSSLPPRASVLITGASSGIGEAAALRFGAAGCRLTLVARREDRLRRVAEQVRDTGGEAITVPTDLAERGSAEQVAARAREAYGGTDVLVNNAGFGIYAPLESVPQIDVERMFAVNTFAALAMTQSVLPEMRRRGHGHIILISSVVGKRSLPMTGAYAASKYALHGIADALRVELSATGIAVSVVCPGRTQSEFSERVLAYGVERPPADGGAMSSGEVAQVIYDCARKPRREILLTGKGKTLAWLQRLSPRLTDWAVSRTIPVRLPDIGMD